MLEAYFAAALGDAHASLGLVKSCILPRARSLART
jgi:hypothetical protein